MQKISILGCGWTGMPLAKKLKQLGFEVKGSTTTLAKIDDMQAHHIESFLIDITQQLWDKRFFDCDQLIITVPPSRQPQVYQDTVTQALASLHSTTRVILLSSISVYAQNQDEVDEDSPLKAVDESSICQVEQQVRSQSNTFCMVRLGGLMGYDRTLTTYFSKKDTVHDRPVNYIHRDDVIQFLLRLIQDSNLNHNVYNLVAPMHPTTQEIYQGIAPDDAKRIQWIPTTNKKVTSKYMPKDFVYHYPNPKHMFGEQSVLSKSK
tara:strand:- start:12265 stop:13053 length:789 start_codon:yes stop_codon:yes gene_type:complete